MKFAITVRAHWSGIVHFVESHITNGILEGINSKIQLAKRRARSYRNINNFINMIYFLCEKLKFDYQSISHRALVFTKLQLTLVYLQLVFTKLNFAQT
jgi:hypothetical protein